MELNCVGVAREQKVVYHFANSNALLHLLVAMGADKDNNMLTAENHFTQNRRRWRTAEISPFAGNLVAVLYE